MNAKIPRIKKVCIKCEQEFEPKPYRQERATHCSLKCRMAMTVYDWFFYRGWEVMPNGCWEWRHTLDPIGGYGVVKCKGRDYRAHRSSYEIYVGPIPDELHVLHHCDNRPCLRPSHLFLGTDADNVADMDAKGRRYILRGSENGNSLLTEGDVRTIRSSSKTGVELSELFGVTVSTICCARRGKTWKHVD